MTGINEVAKEIHENAVAHGWWEKEPTFAEIIALCHSELSEALEEYRKGHSFEWKTCIRNGSDCNPDRPGNKCRECMVGNNCIYRDNKPEGIAVEMADCIIRILDWCGKEGIDIDRIITEKHEYNKTRPYRHGGKRI